MIDSIITFFNFMKSNKKIVFIGYAVLMTLLCASMIIRINKQSNEIDRLSDNQNGLLTDIQYYKTESGKNAARVTQLELTKSEFEHLCGEQAKVIDDMGIKLKRLEYVSSNAIKSNVTATTVLHDTVISVKKDTLIVNENAKKFEWNDDWNFISGIVNGNRVTCVYEGNDTLTIAASKVPKKFLFFKFGCKYIEVNVSNSNPSNRVVWNRTIKVK